MRERLIKLVERAALIGLIVLAARFGIPPDLLRPLIVPPPPPPPQLVPVGPEFRQPEQPPKPQPNPTMALGQIQFGNARCTATVIGPRRSDGRWNVLTASHCIEGQPQQGTMKMKDGRTHKISVQTNNPNADYCWCVTDEDVGVLPFAVLAKSDPLPGTKVWHAGYGIHLPGNREDGIVTGGPNHRSQTEFKLSVSPGDSGGGIFRTDTGELVSCVCCTWGFAKPAPMSGASITAIRAGSPIEASDIEFDPVTGEATVPTARWPFDVPGVR